MLSLILIALIGAAYTACIALVLWVTGSTMWHVAKTADWLILWATLTCATVLFMALSGDD